jgi:hypothetical protein
MRALPGSAKAPNWSRASAPLPGRGLALALPGWLRQLDLPLLVGGVLVHGVRMTLKYRLESNGHLLWWERTLFWGCRGCVEAPGVWIAAAAIA